MEKGHSMNAHRIAFALVIIGLMGAPLPAVAQAKRAPRPGEVESDPIRCWC